MAKRNIYDYTNEDVARIRLQSYNEGKRDALNELMRHLGVDDYIAQKIAEHEAEKHNE